jgi:hypothetical protein
MLPLISATVNRGSIATYAMNFCPDNFCQEHFFQDYFFIPSNLICE